MGTIYNWYDFCCYNHGVSIVDRKMLSIISKPAEGALVKAATGLRTKSHHAYCIHFHLSKLKQNSKNADTTLFMNALKNGNQDTEGQVYHCFDGDFFVILKTNELEVVKEAVSNIRFLHADDPLACGVEGGGIENFATVYNTVDQYEDFFFACNRKQLAAAEAEELRKKSKQEEGLKHLQATTWRGALQSRTNRSRLCMLIVEDQAFSRQLLKESLMKEYIALDAKDAMQGMEVYVANAPDIVFLDIELPDYDGHTVLENLMKLDPDAFIVMTTANNNVVDVKRAIAAGARGYIVKPFTKQKINQYIQLYQTKFKHANTRSSR